MEAAPFVLSNQTRALLHLYSNSPISAIYLPGESGKVSREVDHTFHYTPTRITANSYTISHLISSRYSRMPSDQIALSPQVIHLTRPVLNNCYFEGLPTNDVSVQDIILRAA